MGAGKKKTNKRHFISSPFQHELSIIRMTTKQLKLKNIQDDIRIVLKTAKFLTSLTKSKTFTLRTIPKTGGIIPLLITLFAGLSAIGSLAIS